MKWFWMFAAISMTGDSTDTLCKVYTSEQKCLTESVKEIEKMKGQVVLSTQCLPIKREGRRRPGYDGWSSICSKFTTDFEKELRKR